MNNLVSLKYNLSGGDNQEIIEMIKKCNGYTSTYTIVKGDWDGITYTTVKGGDSKIITILRWLETTRFDIVERKNLSPLPAALVIDYPKDFIFEKNKYFAKDKGSFKVNGLRLITEVNVILKDYIKKRSDNLLSDLESVKRSDNLLSDLESVENYVTVGATMTGNYSIHDDTKVLEIFIDRIDAGLLLPGMGGKLINILIRYLTKIKTWDKTFNIINITLKTVTAEGDPSPLTRAYMNMGFKYLKPVGVHGANMYISNTVDYISTK